MLELIFALIYPSNSYGLNLFNCLSNHFNQTMVLCVKAMHKREIFKIIGVCSNNYVLWKIWQRRMEIVMPKLLKIGHIVWTAISQKSNVVLC